MTFKELKEELQKIDDEIVNDSIVTVQWFDKEGKSKMGVVDVDYVMHDERTLEYRLVLTHSENNHPNEET